MIPAIVAALGEAGAAGGAAAGGEAAGGMASLGGSMQGLAGQAQGLVGKIKDLMNPLSMWERNTKRLYDAVNFLPAKILEVEQMIVSTAQNWVKALAAPAETIKALGDTVGAFVRLANPASVIMFNYRIENAFATIGHILQPIFDALSRAAVTVGDTFARIKPALEPAMRAVAMLIDLWAEGFANTAELLAPFIQTASELLLGLTRVFVELTRPITYLIRLFNDLRAQVYGFFGISTGFNKGAKADIAAREPRYTSAEELQREMAKNALMASLSSKEAAPQTTVSLLQQILNWLATNLGPAVLLKLLVDLAKVLRDAAVNEGKNAAGSVARGGGIGLGAAVGGWLASKVES